MERNWSVSMGMQMQLRRLGELSEKEEEEEEQAWVFPCRIESCLDDGEKGEEGKMKGTDGFLLPSSLRGKGSGQRTADLPHVRREAKSRSLGGALA